MIKVVNPLVRSLSSTANELSWEIESTTEDPLDYTFRLYRSEGPEGPWDPITDTFTDKYYYIDTVIPKYRHARHLFYKIKVAHRPSTTESWSAAFHVDGPTNKYAERISGIERLAFRKFAGQRILVLPIRTFGFRCSCWDPVTGKRQGSSCPLCYNTGFVGGYMNAIETYAKINADPEKISKAQGQETEPRANNIVASNYPVIKPYDLIIQPDLNYRWRVATVAPTRLGGALVHQNLTVAGYPSSHMVFSIEIDEGTVLQHNRPQMLSTIRTTI